MSHPSNDDTPLTSSICLKYTYMSSFVLISFAPPYIYMYNQRIPVLNTYIWYYLKRFEEELEYTSTNLESEKEISVSIFLQ